ncbi:YciI family protein [Tenacibaculum ascidiaceicola]|uniref:YciI family protein n=1 Tax=Tenacibaculum ascidiaceicola TaxID=1699411 RepID=UPI0038961486
MFIINFNFIKPIEEVNKYTESHRDYVAKQYEKGKFIIGGPKVPREGGIVLSNSCTKEEVIEILSKDPLIVKGLAEYSLTEFSPMMSTENLNSYVK